jgi:hypothetical protein
MFYLSCPTGVSRVGRINPSHQAKAINCNKILALIIQMIHRVSILSHMVHNLKFIRLLFRDLSISAGYIFKGVLLKITLLSEYDKVSLLGPLSPTFQLFAKHRQLGNNPILICGSHLNFLFYMSDPTSRTSDFFKAGTGKSVTILNKSTFSPNKFIYF